MFDVKCFLPLRLCKVIAKLSYAFIFLFFNLFSFRLKPLFLRDFQPKSDAHPNSPCLLGGLFVDNLLAQHASMFAKTWIDCGKCTHFGLFLPKFNKSTNRPWPDTLDVESLVIYKAKACEIFEV